MCSRSLQARHGSECTLISGKRGPGREGSAKTARVISVYQTDSGAPFVEAIDEYGGICVAPISLSGGVFGVPAIGSEIVIVQRPGQQDPIVVGFLIPEEDNRKIGDPGSGVDYPQRTDIRCALQDLHLAAGEYSLIVSPDGGIVLDARRGDQPVRIQGGLSVSMNGDASETVLKGNATKTVLDDMATMLSALGAWATALNMGYAQPPLIPLPFTVPDSILSTSVSIPEG